ncbi:trafficking protein particle complex subunit 2, putative [Cordyceps militaris CM01]|uniref:Trafficking protein particle complex subunit 2, putative n=2 Tax=Cordyceps militaris TaxID=73501 RepID=G3JQ17_CORMM|nr:trafficking protein particle complex subunit 2, putative [Cordyceps militaris CM01]ATY67399.1 trafficking particle complex subunit [Cordyceps militaris]EGX89268.1 trafficking protein particle complex subunit 2, putative [Cordyceps militaris CM01]
MSYYFAIVGTQDNPLFEYEFGTSKQGGDGQSRFTDQVRHLNQIILHSSLDVVEEVQWSQGQMHHRELHADSAGHSSRYLKCIDKFFNNYISCFVTGAGAKFLLLHQPPPPNPAGSSRSSTAIGANPTSPATEEAIKMFFTEVYDNWVKAIMNPFYKQNMEVRSPVFRARVAAAGRKYL